ncbi:poly [ADP-ribose] polymerase 2 isoform X2 [Microcaecilia unicolor]|uniref:Poly [ADP-ribose] polymerase n=1 Tax=Microcaecilia unicolor TaxID=1415580 RepID=A0A6P7YR85_9AMPH|nr:poly [ADP-ribose] polymerase 2-like isoform X2 [Microcaecilia unicolor]
MHWFTLLRVSIKSIIDPGADARRKRKSTQCNQEQEKESEKEESDSQTAPELEFRWEWEGDDVWNAYSQEVNAELNEAFRSGKCTITVTPTDNDKFHLDLKKMVQQNTKTGAERRIRAAVRDQESYFVWHWEGDDGSWIPYSATTCLALEVARCANEKSISSSFGKTSYTLDLAKMVQINDNSRYKRKMKRKKSAVVVLDVNLQPNSTSSTSDLLTEGLSSTRRTHRGRKRQSGNSQTAAVAEDKDTGGDDISMQANTDKESVKTLLLKGKAPVDPECSAKLGKAHVFCEGDDIYDVMLNQTNLQFNNNKYYLIQLLEDDLQRSFNVWMRWGRVGKVGQKSLVPCGGDLEKAKEIFQKKFFDKTKNSWTERERFEKVTGKYDILKMEYKKNTQDDENKVEIDTAKVPKLESKLDPRVQSLIELICNIQAIEEVIIEMKYDTKKAPLGKLTEEQIKAGYQSLKKIEDCIKKQQTGKALVEACNEFYTRIPHDFGLRTPSLIRTKEDLKDKIQLLEALSDIEIAVKLVKSELSNPDHPLDQNYQKLGCSLQPLDHSSSEFKVIDRYLQSTHAALHNDYTMTLLDVFEMEKKGEKTVFRQELANRLLLWHGSRLSNWVGILSRGLRVAPPEAPVTGYMFGKGIYFADMSSKSANYCFASRQKDVGLLLLSEVALGDINEKLEADYEADTKLNGKHSTKGLGRVAPDFSNSVTLNGAIVPLGPAKETGVLNPDGYTLNYNEYIVYDPHQVYMKYLLKIQFNFKQLW